MIAVLEAPNATAAVFSQIGVPLKYKYAMKLSDKNFVQRSSVKISHKQACGVQLKPVCCTHDTSSLFGISCHYNCTSWLHCHITTAFQNYSYS
jgi:hypothetical protein